MTVFLGLEKIDDEGLSSVNKSNTAANNDRAIEILQDLGVGYTPNFIVDPSWERKDFDRLKRWIDRTGAFNSGFSILTPLPGTDLWDEVKNDVVTEDWELFDIGHTVLPTRASDRRVLPRVCRPLETRNGRSLPDRRSRQDTLWVAAGPGKRQGHVQRPEERNASRGPGCPGQSSGLPQGP